MTASEEQIFIRILSHTLEENQQVPRGPFVALVVVTVAAALGVLRSVEAQRRSGFRATIVLLARAPTMPEAICPCTFKPTLNPKTLNP